MEVIKSKDMIFIAPVKVNFQLKMGYNKDILVDCEAEIDNINITLFKDATNFNELIVNDVYYEEYMFKTNKLKYKYHIEE